MYQIHIIVKKRKITEDDRVTAERLVRRRRSVDT